MKITLKQNTGENKAQVPYFAEVEIIEAAIDDDLSVPIYTHQVEDETFFNAEICGFRAEVDDIDFMPDVLQNMLLGLINMARLPSYVFIARRSRGVYPVYTVGNEVFATTPGGPVFRHVELAKVREYLSDYLHLGGILGSPGKSDKLHVRGVDSNTLALVRPVFYLKKRVSGENDFWAPVFQSADGKRIYTYAASAKREVSIEDGYEVLTLHKVVAQALIDDKRLKNTYDLRPDRLMPDYWTRLENTLKPAAHNLKVGDLEIPAYHNGQACIGLETRPEENRPSLFVGKDIDDVHKRAEQDFMRRGKI